MKRVLIIALLIFTSALLKAQTDPSFGLFNYGDFETVYISGNGFFTSTFCESSVVGGVALGDMKFADIDGDGDLDGVVVGQVSQTADRYTVLSTMINDGSGVFTGQELGPYGLYNATAQFIDANSDSYPDIIVTGLERNAENIVNGTSDTFLFLNDQSGGFTLDVNVSFPASTSSNLSLFVGDFNGDSNDDVLLNAILFTGDGAGNFTQTTSFIPSNPAAFSITQIQDIGDLNGDGFLDVINSHFDGATTVTHKTYLNDGLGNFTDSVLDLGITYSGFFAIDFKLVDIDNDTYDDIIVSSTDYGSNISTGIILGNATGIFPANSVPTITLNNEIALIDTGDVNNDGFTDILLTEKHNPNNTFTELYLNNAGTGFTQSTNFFEGIAIGKASVADINGDSLDDVILTGLNGDVTQGAGPVYETSTYFYLNSIATSNIIYVNQNANGLNNGSSWANAFTDLQLALDAIDDCTESKQIWVAAGTYKPSSSNAFNIGGTITARNNSFVINGKVELYGGFTGTETNLGQRSTALRTVLSGDLGIQNDNSDNAYHVLVTLAAPNSTLIIDGFSIEDGYADSSTSLQFNVGPGVTTDIFHNSGAGVYGYGELLFRNTVFKNNIAIDSGGAIRTYTVGSATVENGVFENNYAQGGGAISITNGNAIVTNTIFKDNVATNASDISVLTSAGAAVEITNCTFLQTIDTYASITSTGNRVEMIDSFGLIITGATSVENSLQYNTTATTFTLEDLHNSTQDPFIDSSDPDGPDNLWGTADDGLRLAFNSGLFDVGTNGLSRELTTDIKGDPRVFNTTIDFGAYEEQVAQAPCVVTFNNCVTALTLDSDSNICGFDSSLLTPPDVNNCFQQVVSNDAPSILPIGDTVVTWTVSDNNVTDTCVQTITVVDTVAPSAFAKALTVTLDTNGQASITPAMVNDNSTDNCTASNNLQLSIDQSTFNCSDVGPNTVTLTVTDANGNMDTATAEVTVGFTSATPNYSITTLQGITFTNLMAHAYGDLNNDGLTDIAVIDNQVFKVFIQQSNGTFSEESSSNGNIPYDSSYSSVSLRIEDLDSDGFEDVVLRFGTTASTTGFILYRRNNSTGTFLNAGNSDLYSGVSSPSVIDLNNDGFNDIIYSLVGTDPFGVARAEAVVLEYDVTSSQWSPNLIDFTWIPYSDQYKVLDIDNDGDNDILINDVDFVNQVVNIKFIENDSNGIFTLNANIIIPDAVVSDLHLGDYDGDGVQDIVVYNTYVNFTFYHYSQGVLSVTGSFIPTVQTPSPPAPTFDAIDNLALKDFDGDGADDIYFIGTYGYSSGNPTTLPQIFKWNNASSQFTNYESWFLQPAAPVNGEAVDFNNDALTDLFSVNISNSTFELYASINTNGIDVIVQDITVNLDSNGVATITAADIDNGSTSICGISGMSIDRTMFDCSHIDVPQLVVLTVTNNTGDTATGTAQVTVQGVSPVVITQDISINLDATGNAILTPQDVDNGSDAGCNTITSLTLDRDTFTCADTAVPVTVTLSMLDSAGVTTTGTAQVTINDSSAVLASAQDITVYLDENGNAVITAQDVDNGSSSGCNNPSLSLSQTNFDCSHVGANTVTLTASNTSSIDTATAIVTVTIPTEPTIDFTGSLVTTTSQDPLNFGIEGYQSAKYAMLDVNADGNQDMFISGYNTVSGSNKAELYINNNGVYELSNNSSFDIINTVDAVTALNANNDGFEDLIIMGRNTSNASFNTIFINDGSGVFTASSQTLPISSFSTAIETGDIDNDGDDDFFMTGYVNNSNYAELFINDGTGNFTASASSFTQARQGTIKFAQLNGDTNLDIIYTGFSTSWGTYVYNSNGSGGFSLNSSSGLPNYSSAKFEIIDIQNNGRDEILISSYDSTVSGYVTKLFVNNGTGSFSDASITSFANIDTSSFAVGDVNGDSYNDFIIAGRDPSDNSKLSSLFLNDGSGNFSSSATNSFVPRDQVMNELIDLDGDNDLDYFSLGSQGIITNGSSGNEYLTFTDYYLNDSTGQFQLGPITSSTVNTAVLYGDNTITPQLNVVGDLNNDGYADAISYGYDSSFAYSTIVRTNDGNGNYTSSASGINLPSISYLELIDVNGDGFSDVFAIGRNASNVEVNEFYINNGSGSFTVSSNSFPQVFRFGVKTVVGDIDNDLDMDLIIGGYSGTSYQVKAMINNGSGNFAASTTTFPNLSQAAMDLGDLNSDGYLDLILTGDFSGPQSYTYINDGGSTFTQASNSGITAGFINGSVEIMDINGDNFNDVILSGYDGTGYSTKVYLNSVSTSFTEASNTVLDAIFIRSMDSADVDGDGDIDLLVASTNSSFSNNQMSLYLNDGTTLVSTTEVNFDTFANSQVQFIDINNDGKPDAHVFGDRFFYEANGSISSKKELGYYLNSSDALSGFDLNTQDITIVLDSNGLATITPQQIDNGSTATCGIANISLDKTTFDCSNLGVNQVVFTATNVSGGTVTATAAVTVQEATSIVVTQDITVNLDATGNAVITPQDIDNGSAAGCNAITSLTLDRDSFTCADAATPVTVTLSMVDDEGITTTGTAHVTVVDPALPTAIAQDITVSLDEYGNVVLDAMDLDNGSAAGCSIIVNRTVTPASLDCTNIGANMVTLTVTDGNGNTDSTNAIVTVIDDLGPQINVPATYNVQLDPQTGIGQLTAQDLDLGTVDNCGGAVTNTLSQTQFTCNIPQDEFAYNMGSQSFNLEVTSFHVKFDTNFSGPLFFRPETSSSLHNSRNAVISQSGISYGSEFGSALVAFPFQSGTWYKIQLSTGESNTQTDPNLMNVDVEIYLDLTVDDVYIGRATHRYSQSSPGLNNSGMQFLPIKGLVDNLSTASETFTFDEGTGNIATSTAGNTLPVDSNNFVPAELNLIPDGIMVDFISTDGSGNQSIQQVEVITDDLGAVAVSQDITVNLDSGGNITIAGEDVDGGSYSGCNQDVPIASYSVSPNSFDCTNLGPNTVTLTITDGNGQVSTDTATVEVILTNSNNFAFDGTNTGAQLIQNLRSIDLLEYEYADFNNDGKMDLVSSVRDENVFTNQSYSRIYFQSSNGDFVGSTQSNLGIPIDIRGFTIFDANRDSFPDILYLGYTTLNNNAVTKLLINDGSGIFTEDTTNNFTGLLGGYVGTGDYEGDGDLDILMLATGNGTSTQEWYINNGSGSFTSTPATNLPVTSDPQSVQLVDLNADGAVEILINANSASANTVQLYDNDGSGNFTLNSSFNHGTVSSAIIHLIDSNDDSIPDVYISSQDGQSTNNSQLYINDGSGSLTAVTGGFNTNSMIYDLEEFDVDGDGDLDVALVTSSNSLDQIVFFEKLNANNYLNKGPSGIQSIINMKIKATDIDGNNSQDLLFFGEIAGFLGNGSPTNFGQYGYYLNNSSLTYDFTLQVQDITVSLDPTGSASITVDDVDNGSTTVCGFASRTLSQDTFSCADLGVPVPVTVTFTSLSGVTDSAIAMVTVVDDTAPVITLNGNANETLPQNPNYTDLGATAADNCTDPITVVVSGDTVDPNVIGVYTITYTATDASGNATSVDRIVTVEDSIPPSTTAVSIQSDNVNSAFAKAGDLLTLTFTTNEEVQTPTVTLAMVNAAVSATANPNEWIATTFVPNTMSVDMTTLPDGAAPFVISLQDLNGNTNLVPQTATTDGSQVILDRTAPVVNAMNDVISLDVSGNGIFDINAITASITDAHNYTTSTDVTSLDCTLLGSNAFTLYATDEAGNVGQDLFILTVLDELAPVMTLNGNATVTIDRGLTYTDAGVTIIDNCSAGLTPEIGGDVVDTNISGIYEITYDISDASGNDAPQLIRTIIVENPDFIYENGAWTPNDPSDLSNPAGFTDNVIVRDNVTINSDFRAENLIIESGNTLTLSNNLEFITNGVITNSGVLAASAATVVAFGGNNIWTLGQSTIGILELANADLTLTGTVSITETIYNNDTVSTSTLNTTGSTVTLSSDVNGYAIVSGAQLTINGDVVIENYFPDRRAFELLSVPLTTTTTIFQNWQENGASTMGLGTHITGSAGSAGGFDVTGTNNSSMYFWNMINQSWDAQLSTNGSSDTFNAGDFYRLFIRGDRMVDLASSTSSSSTKLRTTGQVLNTDFINTGISLNPGDYITVTNPYQNTYELSSAMTELFNLTSTDINAVDPNFYFIWDSQAGTRGAYKTYDRQTNTLIGPSSVNSRFVPGVLAPSQSAFMLASGEANANLIVRKPDNSIAPPGFIMNQTLDGKLSLQLFTIDSSNQEISLDAILVKYLTTGVNAVDHNDAVKFSNIDETLSVNIQSDYLSIESRAMPQATDMTPLTLTTYRHANYIFKAQPTDLVAVDAYLVDNYANTTTLLSSSSETVYSFTVDGSNANSIAQDRFHIIYQNSTLSTGSEELAGLVEIYPNPVNDGTVYINMNGLTGKKEIKLYTMLGQMITNKDSNTTTVEQLDLSNLAPAVYIIEINNEGTKFTQKLIVK